MRKNHNMVDFLLTFLEKLIGKKPLYKQLTWQQNPAC